MFTVRNHICFAAFFVQFCTGNELSYTRRKQSYTQSYIRNCQ